jgi:transcriptional regulator with XRE-family HTH domain
VKGGDKLGLKDLRLAKGFTLHGLAEVSGVNYQKIWQIENNVIKSENIALKTALKLANALECEPEDLMKPDK